MKLNKQYLPFIISLVIFVIGASHSLYIYLTWDNNGHQAPLIEVSLPVIEWQKYSNLSKQYEPVRIEDNK